MSDRSNKDSFGTGLLERGKCRDEAAQLAISSYLDGEADANERKQAEQHLNHCYSCQQTVLNWRQEARTIASPMFSEGAAYQIQAEVRANLFNFLQKEANRRPARSTIPRLARMGGALAVMGIVACGLLVARLLLGNVALSPADLTISPSLSLTAGSPSTVRASGTVVFSPLAATPTAVSVSAFTSVASVPASLKTSLKEAIAVRYYAAPEGRFAGLTAIVAWYSDNNNRLWILDPVRGETEVSLLALAETGEAVRFYYDDPQALIWSERGAIVAYHLADAHTSEWGLIVPEKGQIGAARLGLPPTAVALARATISPLPRH